MNLNKIAESLKNGVKGTIKISEPMSRHTTWQVGGPADLFFTPKDWADLEKALNYANSLKIPITIIGGGSNLLIKDSGLRGLVIATGGLKNLEINGEDIRAEGGVKLPYLAAQAAGKGLTGLEFAAGIPGTVGGAIVMNAGAHGYSMQNIITSVVVMDYQGRLSCFSNEDLAFTYRKSHKLMNHNYIVIETNLKLSRSDSTEIKRKTTDNLAFRQAKQPWEYPNAGSVFKNPPGDSAGRLIEAIGAKGWQIGGAQVSEKHANFIVNLGGASSDDFLTLIKKIQINVYEKFQINLEPEIKIMGG